jgi:hypothetical protein
MRDSSIEAPAGRRGAKWAAALLLVLPVCLWLVFVQSARAGLWTQVTCSQPDGAPAPVEGWEGSSLNGYGPDSGPTNTCAQRGGALTALDSSTAQEAAYTGPMWVYTAPAGSTIAGGTLKVSLNTPQGEAYVATPRNEYAAGNVLVNCQYNLPCSTATRTVPIINPGGTQLFEVALCVGPSEGATTCPAASGGVNAEINLYAADVELQNGSTPTASGFAGSLLAPTTSGTANLTFGAQDPEGPGVYRVIVAVDGTTVYQGTPDSNGGKCASIGTDPSGVNQFLSAQPCKRTAAIDVPVDTTRFSNGTHELKATVQDAAGNTAVVYDGSVSIANANAGTDSPASPAGPCTPAALRAPAGGSSASGQTTLTARWVSTAKAIRTTRFGTLNRITGRLTTSNEVGIAGALIDACEIPAYDGAPMRRIGSTSTGPTGQWNLTLPRNVSSGTLRFVYLNPQTAAVAALAPPSSTLRLSVHAGIALGVAPHRVSVGRRIVFSGVLRGVPIPAGGKQLVLEARSGGEWIQFETIRTDARGRYRATYRFKFPGPVTYKFRVLSRFEADFPFLDGTSNVVNVHER